MLGLFAAKRAVTDSQVFYQKELYQPAPKVNGEQYAHLPNPGPGLSGDYQVDPQRLFTPDPHYRTDFDQLNRGSGDPAIERVGRADMTRYLQAYQTVDTIAVKVPAHGIKVPTQLRGFGWKQQWIPFQDRRDAIVDFAPPPLLSHPIHEVIVDTNMVGKRVPVKLKAPKPTKG